jgi:hypothetical protein
MDVYRSSVNNNEKTEGNLMITEKKMEKQIIIYLCKILHNIKMNEL